MASFCVLSVLSHLSSAEDVFFTCDNGPDALAPYGAERTCIESPDFEGERCFFTLIPDCAGEDSPLVYDLHGFGGCPAFSVLPTGWNTKAEENCFVLVYPLGTSDPDIVDLNCWNLPAGLQMENGTTSPPCCCLKDSEPISKVDEGPFLRQIAAVLARDIPIQTSGNVTIDTKRIYMAGHSNGCMTSLYMVAQYSDMVAAVGCHAGTGISPFPDGNYIPRPIATVHGKADTVIGYDMKVDHLFTALETYDAISATYNCTTFNETTLSNGENYTATRMASTNCANNASLIMYALENVDHLPYQGAVFGPPDAAPVVVDTTQWMWDFVKQYSLEEVPDLVVTVSTDAPTPVATDATPTTVASSPPTTVAAPTTTTTTAPTADEDSSSPQNDLFISTTAMIFVALTASNGIFMSW
eukprot:scaffold1677_cov122-Cylindrotheca_fusiformis.AAC.9